MLKCELKPQSTNNWSCACRVPESKQAVPPITVTLMSAGLNVPVVVDRELIDLKASIR